MSAKEVIGSLEARGRNENIFGSQPLGAAPKRLCAGQGGPVPPTLGLLAIWAAGCAARARFLPLRAPLCRSPPSKSRGRRAARERMRADHGQRPPRAAVLVPPRPTLARALRVDVPRGWQRAICEKKDPQRRAGVGTSAGRWPFRAIDSASTPDHRRLRPTCGGQSRLKGPNRTGMPIPRPFWGANSTSKTASERRRRSAVEASSMLIARRAPRSRRLRAVVAAISPVLSGAARSGAPTEATPAP